MSTDPWRYVVRRAMSSRDRLRPPGDSRPHVVVCGSDPLVFTLTEELAGTGQRVRVTAIVPPTLRADVPDLHELDGVRVVKADRLDERVFRAAGLAGAEALALVHPDDVTNIHAALCAQEVEPDLRLVMRTFNTSLGYGVARLFADCAVLSDAAMAAPAFVAAALGQVAPTFFRYSGRTLSLARRAEVRPEHIVCVLTAHNAEGPSAILPADGPGGPDDQVLAEAAGRPIGTVAAAQRIVRSRRRRRPFQALGRALRAALNRKLGVAVMVTLTLLVTSGAVLAHAMKDVTGFWKSLYVTLLTAVGSSDVELVEFNAVAQAAQLVLTLAGLALIPLITAAVVEGVVNARLALADGRTRNQQVDHVVLVGLGNVGARVMRQLTDLGIQVVAIDKKPDALGVKIAEQHHIPLIIGDAAREETLRAASIATSRALVIVSTDDVTNLQAALNARAVRPDLRVVLRLFNGDFAQKVQKAFNLGISRSVSYLAAPAFAAAMLDREVIATLPVERHVLLVAEVLVHEAAPLVGVPLSSVAEPHAIRVIGLTPAGEPMMHWLPKPGHPLTAGDRIHVVARRAALRQLAERASAPPMSAVPVEPPPRVVPPARPRPVRPPRP